ncbi:MAG: hypothetical protein Q9220_005447 [cf. Caloplaca sp. 1 TL-2023]
MSDQQSTDSVVPDLSQSTLNKGKGKAVDLGQDVSMGEDDDESSDEETGAEEDEPEQAEEEEDDLQEINTDNIIGGRTRGKAIDYNKVDPADIQDDDEDDDDDDFEDPDADHDAMEH